VAKMRQQGIKRLFELAKSKNVADKVDDLAMLGKDVCRYVQLDENSRSDWMDRSEKAMELALQVSEKKDTPWENASNVKYPLLTTAALQFHARAYPAIIPGAKVVKGQVTGRDDTGEKLAQAMRIANHMNWQLLEENEDWEEEMDRLLLALPIEGCEFKKTYFSKAFDYNCSDWIRPKDFIVNYKTKSLATCPRATHRLWFYPNEIAEKQRDFWSDVDLNISVDDQNEEVAQEFYEQHTLIDLDGDGMKEPWIVTVHVASEKVVRVNAGFWPEEMRVKVGQEQGLVKEFLEQRENAEELLDKAKLVKVFRNVYFTKYSFLPSPDGGFYDIGFGQLIGTLSDAVDTTLNILIDSGTLASMQGGFVRSGLNVANKRGSVKFARGEFKPVKVPASQAIGDSFYQMRFPEPSQVLFSMLGTLIQSVKDVTGVQDIMTGGPQNEETATTTLSRINEGMKVFTSIYKRIHRSLKKEFKKLYKLNGRFLRPEDYFRVLDTKELQQIGLQDYQNDGTDVQPVSDPMAATTVLSMAKAQALLPMKGDPSVNGMEINKRYFESLEIENPEALIQEPPPPQPDPDMARKAQEAASQHMLNKAKVITEYSKVMLNIANAEGAEVGTQLGIYKQQLEEWLNGQASMDGGQGNGGATPVPQGGSGTSQGGIPGKQQQPPQPSAGNGPERGLLPG